MDVAGSRFFHLASAPGPLLVTADTLTGMVVSSVTVSENVLALEYYSGRNVLLGLTTGATGGVSISGTEMLDSIVQHPSPRLVSHGGYEALKSPQRGVSVRSGDNRPPHNASNDSFRPRVRTSSLLAHQHLLASRGN